MKLNEMIRDPQSQTRPLRRLSEVQNRNNCALDETSMKLGIVVDHNPDVENPMRTHLKTVPVPRSDDVIIGQDRKFFHKKFNRNISN